MTIKRTILLFVAAMAIAVGASAQQKYNLRLNLADKAAYTVSTEHNNSSTVNAAGQQMKLGQRMKVSTKMSYDKLSDGNFRCTMTIGRIDMEADAMGQTMQISSADATTNEQNKLFKAIVNKPIYTTLSPQGRSLGKEDVSQIEQAVESIMPNLGKAMAEQMRSQAVTNNFYFPNHPVAVGESWVCELSNNLPTMAGKGETLTVKQTIKCTLKEVTDKFFVLNTVGDIITNENGIELKGLQETKLYIDRNTGIVDHATVKANLGGHVSQMGQEMDVKSIVSGKVIVKPVK
ncbi:hypothetical protein HQ45_01310 [Porphyromonas crevioricanis]|uniref:Lipocalin-like domain-containing protein n=2 Tax=Porphyromonas crevioricanis TaxID=393921 RepID=A0A0A2FRC3_9PORP|nr:DUF6263 family protein [Porphyromonas crevioricanis]KGN90789.1 hypothetical protein HQ45_01310 [Porphyromonas crevioricanis]KGN93967.1 hypothetical protein HQ38_07085 [Porphyromonas crevioricanis]SJZ63536.1 hypothetical protein SAMN02745203_00416 [Porphyromonas crevioricanis]SQH72893.1 Uncharacterised protein [Porphyromonas crevioricanis]GAD04570.1 hypothetical protein PORCRE_258 [Porphyromonas crevioricanis JCM 15906]